MKNINVVDNICTFEMNKDHLDYANSIRRALISDIVSISPTLVKFITNTSCQTDEYIAHRIGLIPFLDNVCENVDFENERMIFHVKGRDFVSDDLKGIFKPHVNIPIMKLVEGQELKGSIKFEKNCGKIHSRFCPVAAVGYEIENSKILFSFESINGVSPLIHLIRALKKLQSRLNNVKYQIEKSS